MPAHLNTPTQSAMQHGLCSSPCYVTALAQIKQLPVQAVHTEQACCSHGFCILKRPLAMPLLAAIICMAGGCCRLMPLPSPPSAGAAHAHGNALAGCHHLHGGWVLPADATPLTPICRRCTRPCNSHVRRHAPRCPCPQSCTSRAAAHSHAHPVPCCLPAYMLPWGGAAATHLSPQT